MDTLGNVTSENSLNEKRFTGSDSWVRTDPTIMQDSSIIIGFSSEGWDYMPWPYIIKFNTNLDTVWCKQIKIERDPKKIDDASDYTEIKKIVSTIDSNIAVLWRTTFVDLEYHPYVYNGCDVILTRLHSDGSIFPFIHPDSVGYWANNPFGAPNNDFTSTIDKGFAFIGSASNYPSKTINTILVKLSDTKIVSAIAEQYNPQSLIEVYPNPTNDLINAKLPSQMTISGSDQYFIELYNMQGNLVQSTIVNKDVNEFILRRNGLPAGIYLLKAHSAKGVQFLNKIIFE